VTHKQIEIALISMRSEKGNDPFIMYQDGRISRRKLIEMIADELEKAKWINGKELLNETTKP
jgi:hypothetical protein